MVIKVGQAGYKKQAVTNFKRDREDLKRKQIGSSIFFLSNQGNKT